MIEIKPREILPVEKWSAYCFDCRYSKIFDSCHDAVSNLKIHKSTIHNESD